MSDTSSATPRDTLPVSTTSSTAGGSASAIRWASSRNWAVRSAIGANLVGQPAVAVSRRLRQRPVGLRALRVFRARPVLRGDLVLRVLAVRPEPLVLTRAHREDDARPVTGADDHVIRLRR